MDFASILCDLSGYVGQDLPMSLLRAYTSTTIDWLHYLPASPHRLTTTTEVPCHPPAEGGSIGDLDG